MVVRFDTEGDLGRYVVADADVGVDVDGDCHVFVGVV